MSSTADRRMPFDRDWREPAVAIAELDVMVSERAGTYFTAPDDPGGQAFIRVPDDDRWVVDLQEVR